MAEITFFKMTKGKLTAVIAFQVSDIQCGHSELKVIQMRLLHAWQKLTRHKYSTDREILASRSLSTTEGHEEWNLYPFDHYLSASNR